MPNWGDILGNGLTVVAGSDQGTNKPGNFLTISTVQSILYGLNVFNGSAGTIYLMLFDATTVPADGTVSPKEIMAIAAGTGITYPAREGGDHYNNGIIAVASTTWGTAGGNLTKTISATASCFFSAEWAID